MNTILAALFFAGFGGFLFFLGAYVERIRWNKLIDDGIIPAPKVKRNV